MSLFKKIKDAKGRTYCVGFQTTLTLRDRNYVRGEEFVHDGWTWRVHSARFPLVTAKIVSE